MRRSSGATEIIRIQVLAENDGIWSCRDELSNRMVQVRAHAALVAGQTLTVELATGVVPFELVRVLGPQPSPPTVPADRPDPAPDVPVLLVNGRPFTASGPDDPPMVGDVRTAWVAFTTHRTGERDRGKTGKTRPVVVVAIHRRSATAEVCPVHGANSAVRRGGSGRRLTGWRELGLRKSSVVSNRQVVVPLDRIGELIGRLGPDDRARLDLPPR